MKRSRVGLLLLLLGCRTEGYEGPPSDHFDGTHFFQPNVTSHKSFFDVLRWQITRDSAEWPESVINTEVPQLADTLNADEISITFVNHATFLIQLPGLNILTDPVWSERVSPVSWAGPKRVRPPGIPFEKLPPIHAVLVSHNHYDHLDVPTLQRLAREHKASIFVPLGDKAWLDKEDIAGVHEVDWGQTIPLGPNVKAIFTMSQHWSARGLGDRNRSLWGSWLVQFGDQRLYFAGDTGYGPHFQKIKKDYGAIGIALLPIGAYEPRWFMKDAHMNPAEAVQAHRDLGATQSLGMHYGCWQLTDESIDQPLEDLKKARQEAGLSAESFAPALVGKTWRLRPHHANGGG